MATSSPFVLSPSSQDAFIQYYKEIMLTVKSVKSAQRARFTATDKAYQRENDTTYDNEQAKLKNAGGDADALQNTTVPIVMPQVEAAVVYQASVFLTGVPIFGATANAQFMDEALQIETTLDNNATRGGWTKEFMMFFRDGFKYNYAPIEVDWATEKVVNLTTNLEFSKTEAKPEEVIWKGNKIKRWNPYNSFLDPRVPPTEVYKDGEFAGHTEFKSRIKLKQEISELAGTLTMNIKKAFETQSFALPGTTSGETIENYYVPDINPKVNPSDSYAGAMNWMTWVGLGEHDTNNAIDYKNSYEKTTLYCKILPSEFGLRVPGSNTPQIWKLIIINHQVIIHAERQTNAHNWIPVLVGMPHEDGLALQTKSLAEDAEPFQEVTTTFMNSIIASRRRAISDRTLYDPSRVLAAHINAANPSAKIPVRPAAYGKKISDAVHQFPYREDQGAFSMQQIGQLIAMANNLAGQNPARQGQFVKGNKTREEFDSTMQNANGRDQLVSILLEAQVFVPMKQIFKLDILQYQGAGTEYSRDKEKPVKIDPVALRKAILEFKISDGLVPSDKIINADAWRASLQVLGSSPELASEYNVGPLFSYLMKTQGANITQFEKSKEQVAYEQAVQAWQQMMWFAIEKGMDPEQAQQKLPPQPLPEQFGYKPGGNEGAEVQAPPQSQLTAPASTVA